MALEKCKQKGCDPVEQVRSAMTHADYFDVLENDKMEAFVNQIKGEYQHELDDYNENDVRIICRKCHKTTGWARADAPGMPGVGLDYLRKKWNAE